MFAVAGPAGPSHAHAPALPRLRRSQRVQAVAVKEHVAPFHQNYAEVASGKALAGIHWGQNGSGAWQAEGGQQTVHCSRSLPAMFIQFSA